MDPILLAVIGSILASVIAGVAGSLATVVALRVKMDFVREELIAIKDALKRAHERIDALIQTDTQAAPPPARRRKGGG